ncbi:MAG: transposase zinc-binding domain-containing protein [Candidatus Helarchaeota archaeon]
MFLSELIALFWDISYYLLYLISFIIFSSILPQKLTFQKKIGVKEIFEDNNNWERYKNANLAKLDKWVIKNTEKMLKCKDPKFGYLKYQCETCDEIKSIKFSCNSRICSRCGKRYTDQWSKKIAKKLIPIPHRHFIFTIPSELWSLFEKDIKLWKTLLDIVKIIMNSLIIEHYYP